MCEQWGPGVEGLVLTGKLLSLLFRPSTWRWKEIISCTAQIGMESLPIICLGTSFAGIIMTHEIAWHMDKALHSISMVPGPTGQFIVREIGIAIPALLLVAKVGAAITAEVGSMKITEQIDALRLLGINPVEYLAFPRFIASLISGACLTLISIAITLACSTAVAALQYHFTVYEYLNLLHHFLGPKDIFSALIKGTLYGGVIPTVSCTYGFRCRGGAEGVGTATTQAVVTSTIIIILLDFILTYLFTWIL